MRFQRRNSEGLARELRGFSAGLAWGLIFFALRVASRQNTFDSNIAMPVLYVHVSVNVHFVKMTFLFFWRNWPFLSKRILTIENF